MFKNRRDVTLVKLVEYKLFSMLKQFEFMTEVRFSDNYNTRGMSPSPPPVPLNI